MKKLLFLIILFSISSLASSGINLSPYGGNCSTSAAIWPSRPCTNGSFAPSGMMAPPRFNRGYDCIACQMNNTWSMPRTQRPPFMPHAGMPWWSTYGRTNYNNFHYPGVWGSQGWGLNGRQYAGHSNGHAMGMAGKPNVYFSSNKDINLKVRINFKNGSSLLSAAPIHGKTGWIGKLFKNGRMTIENSEYNFLYYDYVFDVTKLQNDKGFCVQAKSAVSKMANELYSIGFLDHEIKDFTSYWTVKLPKSDEFCIYPQITSELSKLAELEITPPPTFLTRVIFMVIPSWAIDKKKVTHFTKRPQSPWKFLTSISRNIASPKDYKLEVREWGVAFLSE